MMYDEKRYRAVWRYSARDGKLTVCEKIAPRFLPDRRLDSKGPSVYLFERDDKLARDILLQYEKEKLADLQKQINRKLEVIKRLEEG